MATRIQVRRGTTSEWNAANPTLVEGEFGYNTTLDKFKIGDGTSTWSVLEYVPTSADLSSSLGDYIALTEKGGADGVAELDATYNVLTKTAVVFEGATADAYETTLLVIDPTADRSITLPNVDGTVITTGNLSDITNIGVFSSTIVMEGSTANDFELTLSAGDPTADRTITFPDATGTVALTTDIAAGTVTETGTQTLTNKSISLGSNTVTSTLAQLNTAISDADVATLSGTETLTNKTLTSPKINEDVAVTATATELNYVDGVTSAIQTQLDAKSTESKTETLTNKSISLGSNTVTSTLAQLNSAVSDADVASLAGAETLTNKTLTSPVINTPTGITKTDVGLANVDNTTDAGKPVSTATQTALDLKANLSGATFTGAVSGTDLTLSGNLTVNGTTTNINSTNLVVEDKNIVLGDTAEPADATADGGGITLKGTTDKTFNWVDATDAWTSSEDLNLLTGKVYEINGTSVLSSTTLGSGVTGSSLTSVGTITSGTWTGTAIAIANGGTGQTTAMTAATALLPDQASNSGKYLTTDGSGTLSWGTVSGYSAPTLGSTSIASGATVTNITGLTINSTTIPTSSTLLVSGGALGTPASATLTNATGLPISGLTSSTSAALGLGTIELGHATDTTISRVSAGVVAIEGVNIVTTSSTDTLTNKTLSSAVATTALTLNATGELRLADTDSTHYVGFKAPGTVSTNRIWTLPSADGTTGQVLQTNGSGTLSFSTPAAGAAFSEFMLIGA